MSRLPRRTQVRTWRIWTAVVTAMVLVAAGLSAPGTAAAAPTKKPPGEGGWTVVPPGNGGWKPAKPPKSTTMEYKSRPGSGGPQVLKPDPHAKRVKELTGKRTANASYFQMSDGSVQQEVSAAPVHYRDTKGVWKSIDPSVKKVAHDGFTLGAQANSFHTYFSPNASSLVRIEQGSTFVQLGADGASTAAPKAWGSSVVYANAYPGADLSYQVGSGGVKESIILSKRPAAGQAYSFTLRVGGDLVPRQLPDGAIEFDRRESGTAVFAIPAPYMSDSKTDANSPYGKAYSTKVSQEMSFDAASGLLHVTIRPDSAWLADSKRAYPVVVDPTIVVAPTPSTAANTMIQAEAPAANNSNIWRLSVGTTTAGAVRSLIRFPLPSIPANTAITSADLALYYDQVFYDGTHDVPMQALQANASWNPTTATWNNAGSIGGPVAGSATMKANVVADWVHFPVTSAVQNWVNGTANNGFVLKAANEATLGQGGPRFEGSIYAYGGEVVNYPKLVITYGVPGVAANPPKVIHATGAELSWPAYTNTTGDSANDLAEYQVHRSVFQTFTPGQNTLVSPVASTSFVDSTAVPTAADSSDPYGNFYYYMVAVKTKEGKLIAGPVTQVRLPKAGRTTILLPATAAATLSSKLPNSNLTSLVEGGLAQPWLEVGDNSSTYGVARTVLDFGDLSQVPSGARILESHLKMWQETTTTNSSGAVYELHGLTRSFTGTQVTWNSAATSTAWTAAGGDFSATVAGTVSGLTNDPSRQNFDATSVVQGWVDTPSSNHGLLVKLKAETSKSPQERTIFAGRQTAEAQLAPQLVVTYLDNSTGATYYAPSTPTEMVVGQTYTTPVTINNTTSATWSSASQVLTYHWILPDGTDVTNSGNQKRTSLPSNLAPGATVTLNAQVTPPTPTGGNEAEGYSIAWDMYDTSTSTYLSGGVGAFASDGIEEPGPLRREDVSKTASKTASRTASPLAGTAGAGSLKQQVSVDPSGNNQLGLEHFYQYATTPTGAGTNLYTNISSGNTVWSYDILSNPSVGFDTQLRLSYNSLSTFDTGNGYGWSIQASTPTRLGQALQFNPTWNSPTEVVAVDGTGNAHKWTWNAAANQWTSPPGVHLYLQKLASCTPQTENARAWSMTRPDRKVYYFDCAGFPTAAVDNNGNEAYFTYSRRQSSNKPTEFLTYITDPMFRQTLKLTYYNKGESYSYVDYTGNLVEATNLTAPGIVDSVKSITDVSGRTINFYYTLEGLLGRLVDGAGDSGAKTFKFSYDATQGMKNVKLTAVQDPRGHTSNLSYYPPLSPWKWMTQSVSDRLDHTTTFDYLGLDPITGASRQTTVTDARQHRYVYKMDPAGRMVQGVDPNSHTTELAWDADNNVKTLTENNGATTSFTYDPKTGYPLSQTSAQQEDPAHPRSTTYTYQYSPNGYVADLTDVTSAAGRRWHYTYDDVGNLHTAQEPNGTATGSGYITTFSYDTAGRLESVQDANGHFTNYGYYRDIPAPVLVYDPTGLPTTVIDPLGNFAKTEYGPRGEPKKVTDPLGATATQSYDVFGRPAGAQIPKDHTANPPVIINYPAPVYDRNNNIAVSTAPNGAVTTAVYDANDQLKSTTLPPNTTVTDAPDRVLSYTYDAVGNLKTVTEPKGNLPAPDGSYTTTMGYDDADQLISVTDAMGHVTTVGYDNVGNQKTVTEPKGNVPNPDGTYTTTFGYDLDHRPTSTTDAENHTSSVGYDPDGLVVSSTDQNGATTLYSPDRNGRIIQVQVPHSGTGTNIEYNTAGVIYDQVGNLTDVFSPRSLAAGAVPGSFKTEIEYDAANQRKKVFGAYDAGLDLNDRYGKNNRPETDYDYDAAGRVKTVTQWVREPGKPATSITSKSDYFDNGLIKHTTDPFNIATDYDYNVLGQQTSRKLTPAEPTTADSGVFRQMNWGYYPDGSLASFTDAGLPNSWQDQIVTADAASGLTMTGWEPGPPGAGYNGSTYYLSSILGNFIWNVTIPDGGEGDYSIYVWMPNADLGNESATYVINQSYDTVEINQSANATGKWVQLANPVTDSGGKWHFNAGVQEIQLERNGIGSDGVVADAVRVVRNDTNSPPSQPTTFTYAYDANGNQTDMVDNSPTDPTSGAPTAQFDHYLAAFDQLNRPKRLEEKKAGDVKHTLTYDYDDNSNLKTFTNDGAINTYGYDTRNLLSQVLNKQNAADPGTTTGYTYFPNGQRKTQTKSNQNKVDYTYNLDGTLARIAEATPPGALIDSHYLSYDKNNNITQDITAIRNADQTSAFLNRTRNFEYSPNNQLTTVKEDPSGTVKESYEYDSLGEITKQVLGDKTVDNTYDRGRLMSSSQGAVAYQYDAIGRMTAVGGRIPDDSRPGRFTLGALQQYRYDGYDNIVYQSGSDDLSQEKPVTTATTSTYDSLNRPITSKVAISGGTLEHPLDVGDQTFDYLATSRAVTTEKTFTGSSGPIAAKTYDYSPAGERLALHDSSSDLPPIKQDAYYTYNPHQDVEALTGPDGMPIATYGYTAYGQDDKGAYGDDKTLDSGRDKDSSLVFPLNSYRFNSARLTGSTGTLDMGFRTYNPSINQFLNRDTYNGAFADAGLAGGRYGFAGGNPLSNIELNGHSWKSTLAGIGGALLVVGVCAAIGVGTAGVGFFVCGAIAGAAAGAASQGVSCHEGQAGACSGGAFAKSIGFGAAAGLIGAGIGFGVAAVLPETMAGWASGAIIGAASGGGSSAAGYGMSCAAASDCSWTGLGVATAGGALLGGALGAGFGALAAGRARPISPEDAALRTAIKAGRVKADADVRHRNGAMAEQLGYERALADGEVGIIEPGGLTQGGPDFVTYNPKLDIIRVWDAKYMTNARSQSVSATKLAGWVKDFVEPAVNNYTGQYAAAIRSALANNQVEGKIFPYVGSQTGWSAK